MSASELVDRRLAALQVAREARKAKQDAVRQQIGPSGRTWMDMGEWERLASEAGVRLPQSATPLTTGVIRRWLRRLGISRGDYLSWSGGRKVGDFIALNPDWTARAWVGLVIEHRDLIGATP